MRIYTAIAGISLLFTLSCGSKSPKDQHQAPAPKPGDSQDEVAKDEANPKDKRADGSKEKKPENPTGAALNCEEQWQKMLAQTVVGEFSVYETSTKSVFSGNETLTTGKNRQEVTAVSSDKISWKYHSEMNGTSHDSVGDLKKADYTKNCGPSENKPAEEGDEQITVKAGTFQTHWLKFVKVQSGTTTTTKMWVNKTAVGGSFAVKTESNSVFPEGSVASTTELVAIGR